MKNIMKSALAIITVINILLASWVTLSWIDVASDNLSANPQHHEYNFFVMLADQAD